MGLAITAVAIVAVCLIAALLKRAESHDETVALQNRLEASRDSQLQDYQEHYVPDPVEDSASEDFINLEQHWNP